MAQVLLEEYNGEVPKTRKELESLPGVGEKQRMLFYLLVLMNLHLL